MEVEGKMMSFNVSRDIDAKDATRVKNPTSVIPFRQTPRSMMSDSRHGILPANKAVKVGRCNNDRSAPPQIETSSLLAKAWWARTYFDRRNTSWWDVIRSTP